MRHLFWITMLLGVVLVCAASCLAQEAEDERADIETLREMIDSQLALEEEESEILRDALSQIDQLRERHERDEDDEHEADEHDEGGVDIQIDIDEETVEAFERQLEEHMEELGASIEAWAEDFEAHMEKWGEQFGEDMEAWGEEFGKSWDEWSETHGEEWDEWGNRFGSRWEEWAKLLEDGHVTEEQLKELIEGNLDMIKEMPLEGLYEQLRASTDQLKDLPWERFEGLEELIAESMQQGLRGLEQLSDLESKEGDDVAEGVRSLQESLDKLQQGLDIKSSELEAARVRALADLLARQPKRLGQTDLERQRLIESLRRAEQKDAELRAIELDQVRKMLEKQLELSETTKRNDRDKLKAMLKEITAQKKALRKDRDRELDMLRAEISQLRKEVDRLRDQRD